MNYRLFIVPSLALLGAALLTSSAHCMEKHPSSTITAALPQEIIRPIGYVTLGSILSYDFKFVQEIRLYPYITAYSNEGIALTRSDGSAQLLAMQTAEPLHVLKGHTGPITGVALSSDGSIGLTGSKDKTARLWNAKTGEQIGEPLIHEEEVIAVGLSVNGETALTKLKDGTICFWDVKTGQKDTEIRVIEISSIGYTVDGEITLEGPSYRRAPLKDLPKNCQIDFRRNSGRLSSIALSPDKTLIVTGSSDGEICLWNANTGNHIRTLNQGPRKVAEPITFITFSPDGTTILTGSDRAAVFLFDSKTGTCLRKLEANESRITLAQFSADGNKIFVGSLKDAWVVWKRSSITNDWVSTRLERARELFINKLSLALV